MNRSDSLTKLAEALALAQAEIEGARKDSNNPHFRSKYADLGAVWDACRVPLTKHGLSVVQFPRSSDGCVEVETILMHKSGEWMSDALRLPVSKQDAQGYGSAMTYARRYSLMAVAGIAPEDDDGNAAVAGSAPAKLVTKTAPPRANVATEDRLDWDDLIDPPAGTTRRNAAQSRELFKPLAEMVSAILTPEDGLQWAKDNAKEIFSLCDEARHHLRDKYNNRIEDLILERSAA